MKKWINWIKKPIVILLVVVIAIFVAGYFYFTGSKKPTYEFSVAKRAGIIQEVSVTGRVKTSREVNLAFKRAGRVSRIALAVGQTALTGGLLLELETDDERRAVEKAELALADAMLTLDKLLKPVSRRLVEDKLEQAYEGGLVAATSLYADFYTIFDDLNDIFFGDDLSPSSTNDDNIDYYADVVDYYDPRFKNVPNEFRAAYQKIKSSYGPAFADYQAARASGDDAVTEQAIMVASDLAQATVNLIKVGRDTVRFFKDKSIAESWQPSKPAIVDGHLASLADHYATINGYWLDLLKAVTAIKTEHNALDVDKLDVESAKLEIKRQEVILAEAKERLADSYLRAPFTGVVTVIEPEVGEIVPANTVIVSLISAFQFEIKANVAEADIAKVKIGNSAKVTLDAYGEDVVFKAKVVEIEPAETIIEGVATYKTTFQFIKEDERIKSGMTANIDIMTDKRENVIVVPRRSVTTKNGDKIVKVLIGDNVSEIKVKTGLAGSDGNIEIIEGIKEGDKVIISLEKK